MSLNRWLEAAAFGWRKRPNKLTPSGHVDTQAPLTWFWTCGGEFFGYRSENGLFTYGGQQAGQFGEGDEIYDSNGEYLGEVRLRNRLITNRSKRTWRRKPFLSQTGARVRRSSDLESIQIAPGFEDFPSSSHIA